MRNIIKSRFTLLFTALIFASTTWAQTKTISGKVSDANTLEELIGVTVKVEINGTIKGAITDIDGNYQLECSEGDVLTFSFIGYLEQDINVGGATIYNVSLFANTENLDELIVIGYGVQKKESVVGAISSIGNEDLIQVPASNVTQSLAGRLSGVQVVQTSGEVGRDEASIFVRGLPTFGNASPLIVVDGIVRESFAQIDPNEIQSINVLKDASATSVYGIKGANGVIIVTTRRGRVSKPQISVTVTGGLTQPTRIPEPLDAYRTVLMENMKLITGGENSAAPNSNEDIMLYQTGASPYTHPDYSWVDVMMKDYSTQTQANANITGGTETIKYFISGGYYTQNGVYNYDDNTRFSRYNFRSNFDINITKDFTAKVNIGTRVEKRRHPAAAWYGSWGLYRASFATSGRHTPYLNPDGSLGGNGSRQTNLIGEIRDRGYYDDIRSNLELGIVLKHELDFITKGLSINGQIAFDDNSKTESNYQQSYSVYSYKVEDESYKSYGESAPLQYAWGNVYDTRKVYGELSLQYNRVFQDKHTVHAMLLGNRDLKRVAATNAGNIEMPYASQGIVTRSTYNYDSRYYAEASVTYNGSENFPPESRYGLFPSFALGWTISNERFIEDSNIASFLSNLKFRGSYGLVGNDRIGGDRFMYLPKYLNEGGYRFGTGNDWYDGIRKADIENANVQWEVGRKTNIGFESNFFNGLFELSGDYFYEYRDNILLAPTNTVPYYVGASFSAANVGIVENEGFEFEFKHSNDVGQDFNYYISSNFSYAHSTILQKDDPALALEYQKEAGFPVSHTSNGQFLLGYIIDGVFEDYDDIENSPAQIAALGGIEGNNAVYPGDIKYKDINGDGVINEDDKVRFGYPTTPEITYGVTLGANFKGFDAQVLFQGAARAMFEKNWEIQNPMNNSENALEQHWDYWTPLTSGESEYMTRLYTAWKNNQAARHTFSVGSGNYLRIKSAQIGYTIPDRVSDRIKMNDVRIYVSGLNLHMWSKEPYLDPDNRNYRGGLMPPLRTFNCGINLKF